MLFSVMSSPAWLARLTSRRRLFSSSKSGGMPISGALDRSESDILPFHGTAQMHAPSATCMQISDWDSRLERVAASASLPRI
jgi:hypothetical protein